MRTFVSTTFVLGCVLIPALTFSAPDAGTETSAEEGGIACKDAPFASDEDRLQEWERAQVIGDRSCYDIRDQLTKDAGKIADEQLTGEDKPNSNCSGGTCVDEDGAEYDDSSTNNPNTTNSDLSPSTPTNPQTTGNDLNAPGAPSTPQENPIQGDIEQPTNFQPPSIPQSPKPGAAPQLQYNCDVGDNTCFNQFVENNFSEVKDGDRFSVDTGKGDTLQGYEGQFIQCTGANCGDPSTQAKVQAHNAAVANDYFASGAGLNAGLAEGANATNPLIPTTELNQDAIGAAAEIGGDHSEIFNARGRLATSEEIQQSFSNPRDFEVAKILAAKEGVRPDDITASELERYRNAVKPLSKNISGATRNKESSVTVNGLTVPEQVQLAVAEYNLKNGTNYSTHVFSEMGAHGSMRHRTPGDLSKGRQGGCACAADMYIYDGNGKALTHRSKDQVVAAEIGKIYAKNTGGTFNFGSINGSRYMVGHNGEMGIHADVANLHYRRGGYTTGWNAIARDPSVQTAVSNMSVGKTFSQTSNGVRYVSSYSVNNKTTGAPTTVSPSVVTAQAPAATPPSRTSPTTATRPSLVTSGNSGSLRIPTTGVPAIDTTVRNLNRVFDSAVTPSGGSALPTSVLSNLGSGGGNMLSSLFKLFNGGGSGSNSSPSSAASTPVLRPAVPIPSSPPFTTPTTQSRTTAANALYNLLRQQGQELDQLGRGTNGTPSFAQLRSQLERQNSQLRQFADQYPAADQSFIQQMIRENDQQINGLLSEEIRDLENEITDIDLQLEIDKLNETIRNLERELRTSGDDTKPNTTAPSNLTATALRADKITNNEYRFRGSLSRTLANKDDHLSFGELSSYFGSTVEHELLIDYQCDGTVDDGIRFSTPYYSILPRADGADVLLSEYVPITEDGLHCFAFAVDVEDAIPETKEDDNTSTWREFIAGFGVSKIPEDELPPLNFEVSVYSNDLSTQLRNWVSTNGTTEVEIEIQPGQQLVFRWNAVGYKRCIPLLSALTPGMADNTDPENRNTLSEQYDLHEHQGYYQLRCEHTDTTKIGTVYVDVQ